MKGKNAIGHRLAYQWLVGPIPGRLKLDHKCHVKHCVNPRHLRPVTTKENGENRHNAPKNSKSGVRGVVWCKGKWKAQVRHNGVLLYLGRYGSLEEADAVVTAKRNELFTHNDGDR